MFKDGKPNGTGKMTYKNGDTYQGEYKLGEIEGQGIMKWKDGKIQDGLWIKSIKTG